MSDSLGGPAPSDRLPDTLVEAVDRLGMSELRALMSYVEQRIESLRTPLSEEIEAEAAGELLGIENHGVYALVRMRPPGPDGEVSEAEPASLYHVSRERGLDGEESLHWAYLGDIRNTGRVRCENCGRSLDETVAVCPHCGSEDVEHTEEH